MKHKTGDFPCDTCNKSFAYKKHFDDHMLTHDVEKVADGMLGVPKRHLKLHACDVCDKSYQRKDHLTRHRLVHSGARPHVCLVCMKSFVRKDKLQRHERIHYKEKRFQYNCSQCNRVFLRKDTLEKHKKTHLNETETKMPKDGSENRNNMGSQNISNSVVSNTIKLESMATSGSDVNTTSKPIKINEIPVTVSHGSYTAGKLDTNNINEMGERATSKLLNISKSGVNNSTGFENYDYRRSEGRSHNSDMEVMEQKYNRPQAIHTSVFEALNASQS